MARDVLFSIFTPSQHPADNDVYDSRKHQYLPEYVNPASWQAPQRMAAWNEFRLLPDRLPAMALLAAVNHVGIVIHIGGDGQIDPKVEATIKAVSCDFK